MDYVQKHWRGHYSFSRSFWVNLISPLCIFQVALQLSKSLISNSAGYLEIAIYVALIFSLFPLYWLSYLWSLTGTVRAEIRYKNSVTSTILKGIAFFILTILTVFLIIQTVMHISAARHFSSILLKNDPTSLSGFKHQRRGQTLRISGTISFNLPLFLEKTLSEHQEINRLHIESSGGYLIPAHQIIKLVTQRKLDTYVGKSCLSACSIIFLAGNKRIISKTARLGFHQPHSPLIPMLRRADYFRKEYNFMKSRNIPDSFISRALGTPATTLWFPTHKELIVSGYVTHITESSEQ